LRSIEGAAEIQQGIAVLLLGSLLLLLLLLLGPHVHLL
jgi:hypothetical protein